MTVDAPRKKSENRQRQKQIKIRCTAEEFNAAAANAAQSGLSVSGYARAAMLGNAGARAKARLPVDGQLLRQVLAQHGRYGNNLNQIAYVLNAEGSHKVLKPISAPPSRNGAKSAISPLEPLDAPPMRRATSGGRSPA